MGSCFSEPAKSSRRRHSRSWVLCQKRFVALIKAYMLNLILYSKRRCAPVQYEYYYSTRDGETVLVRHRIEQTRRRRHCGTDASSSLNVNLTAGNRHRHHSGANLRTKRRREKKNRGSHCGGGASHQSHGSRRHATHGKQASSKHPCQDMRPENK
ncbi:hypothetical protein V8C37DRAFT_378604 [Trichoderma ceciliae]